MKQAAALEKTAPRSGSVSTLTAAASNLAAASLSQEHLDCLSGGLGPAASLLAGTRARPHGPGRFATGRIPHAAARVRGFSRIRRHGVRRRPVPGKDHGPAFPRRAAIGPGHGRASPGRERPGPGPGARVAVGPGRYRRRRCQQRGPVSRGLAGCGPDCRHVGLPATGV